MRWTTALLALVMTGAGFAVIAAPARAEVQAMPCSLAGLSEALVAGGDYAVDLPSNGRCYISVPTEVTLNLAAGTTVTLRGVDGDPNKVQISGGYRTAVGFTVAGSLTLESLTIGGFNRRIPNGPSGVNGSAGRAGDGSDPNGGDGGDGTPGGNGADADGGAFHVLVGGSLRLNEADVRNNDVHAGSPGHGGHGGAGGWAAAGGVGGNGGDGAGTGRGGRARGGAIFNEGTVRITNSVLLDNEAIGGGSGTSAGRGGDGGDTFVNSGVGGAGGTGATAGIPGDGLGGAIYNVGSLTVSGTEFNLNLARGGHTFGGGGGSGGDSIPTDGPQGVGGAGGRGGPASQGAIGRGGAIYSEGPFVLTGGSTYGNNVLSSGSFPGGFGFGGYPGGANAEPRESIPGTADHPDFFPDPVAFNVELRAHDATGSEVDGALAIGQDVTVTLSIQNLTGQTVSDIEWAGDAPITVDGRSTGGVAIIGDQEGADAIDSIAAGETKTWSWVTTATGNGVAAVMTKLTATTAGGDEVTGQGSLKYTIGDGEQVTRALKTYLRNQVVRELLDEAYRNYQTAMINRSNRLATALRKRFSAAEAKQWFGDAAGVIRPTTKEYAQGHLTAMPGEAVSVHLPKSARFKGYTYDELNDAYNSAFMAEAENGVKKWVKGWGELGAKARKGLKDTWSESVMVQRFLHGQATAEEKDYLLAYYGTLIPGTVKSVQNMYAAAANEITGSAGTDANAAWYAVTHSVQQLRDYKSMLSSWVAKEDKFHADLIKLADTNPIRFQQEWATHDAEIFNAGFPTLAETIIPAGTVRLIAAGSKVQMTGKGAAMVEMAIDAGVLNENGQVASKASKIYHAGDAVTGTLPGDQIRVGTEKSMLASRGTLVIESADYGHVYEMPNFGGLPTTTLDTKAKILDSLETAYFKATGRRVSLAEVLKKSSPLRKEGDVAKLELTAGKSGKPAMLDAGMPDGGLAEANYWHSPTPPEKLPGWNQLGKARQEAAVKEWKAANKSWADWADPEVGSKEWKLKQVTGRRGTVPLDDEPNVAGIQRFVTAEFEAVPIKKGKAEGVLIRVKHYEISVVDANTGQVVDTKNVINNLAKAAPQTADADAVALGKVVGRTGSGEPIIEPLTRAEKEFFTQRYIDANIKARRSGVGTDLAEHGMTLNMFDASAKAAGKLIPSYGVPFMPESVGRAFLNRIAPFVKPKGLTNEQMVEKMLGYVESNGGFGSHAVTVTRDGRWLGEVSFASW